MTDHHDFISGLPVPATVTSVRPYRVNGALQSVVSVSVQGGLVINDLQYPGPLANRDVVQVQNDPRSGKTDIIGLYPAAR